MVDALREAHGKVASGRISARSVRAFLSDAFLAAGASPAGAQAATQALVEASLRGIDSHGIRLVVHYCHALRGGRLKGEAAPRFLSTGPSTGQVDGQDGLGHLAAYAAADAAVELAKASGVGAVGVVNSSHLGAAGCYAMRIAEARMVGLVTCNSDSFVLPHGGISPFHGTNPLAFAAPFEGEPPLLVDMATSIVPWNRVQDLMLQGLPMPSDVSVDAEGWPTIHPERSAALLPLGGMAFGFKGAALASIAEILSAVVTGSPHCSRLPAMRDDDMATPRHLGHFVLAIDPTRFVSWKIYATAARAYRNDLRAQPARAGAVVLAPGDREWAIEEDRSVQGIPVGPEQLSAFDKLAALLGIPPLLEQVAA